MLTLFYVFLLSYPAQTDKLPANRAAARPLTACGLVTRAEVEEAVGRRVEDGVEEREGAASSCEYAAKGGLVSIAVQTLTAKPDRVVELAALKKEIPEGIARDAAGFGDAFWLEVPGAGAQLHIVEGGEHLMISILGFGEASKVSDAAARMARKALRRMRERVR